MDERNKAAVEGAIVAFDGLTLDQAIGAFCDAMRDLHGKGADDLVTARPTAFIAHPGVVSKAEFSDIGELVKAAHAVVDARHKPGGDWDELKDAIQNLADCLEKGN